MTNPETNPSPRSGQVPPQVALLVAILALAISAAAIAISLVGASAPGFNGMMSGNWGAAGSQPSTGGFVAGTVAKPRVIQVTAGPGFEFYPAAISVVRGETVTFAVTTMGPTAHEFMVGPADAVAADATGTPEIDEIRMMEARTITYTFDGPGPFAFACHAAGHYEAGMRGTITVVTK